MRLIIILLHRFHNAISSERFFISYRQLQLIRRKKISLNDKFRLYVNVLRNIKENILFFMFDFDDDKWIRIH